jgi:4-amino-4-deoxy-L-arabinose transferase-like glycosyltransferase
MPPEWRLLVDDSTACYDDGSVRARWDRWFRAGAVLVLALAAVNLFFRLDREVVTEWDEALYAISAAETARNGNWIGTTFGGTLDYYNTKPPLNIWLIALSFKAVGINLVTLRIASALAAWLTVLVLPLWARRAFGATTALLAGLVLSATYGFIYVHSARSGNTDALFTLFVLLTVVTLWTARDRPWRLAWLGPILATVFLLRGMAVLMPLILAGTVLIVGGRWPGQRRWPALVAAVLLAAVPIGSWAWARWRLDGWQFLGPMFYYDFVARTATALEGHTGSLLYYPNTLQKDHYVWLIAAAVAIFLFPLSRERFRRLWSEFSGNSYAQAIAGAWLGVTVLIPTMMQTKVAWYLNPFYPLFALLVGRTFAQGFV